MSINLHIKLLGEFCLVANESPITGVNSERLQALLAFILLHRDTPQPRQQIATQLWPDATDTEAKANLRRRLHELKQLLPDANRWLHIEPKTVHWVQREDCWIDVVEFEQAIAQAQQAPAIAQPALEQVAKLYQGDLLLSCYDDWIVPYRERMRQKAIAALDTLITLCTQLSQARPAMSYAQQLQRLDPLYEPAYCHLMRLHAQVGDRAGALRIYHQCMTTLQAELGVNPSPTTCKLYEELLTLEDIPPGPTCIASTPSTPLLISTHSSPNQISQMLIPPTLPLVGREIEWSLLEQWHSQGMQHYGPNLLLVLGEPGIGKTRLLEELAHKIQASHGYVLWGRGFEAEMLRPYGVWADAFQGIGATEFLDELRALLFSADSPTHLNRGRLFDLAVQFMMQLGESSPVLVILDDIQWVDETSIAFLHYAARLLNQRVPILFACTARKQDIVKNLPVDRFIQALQREHRIQMLELAPLQHQPILALARAVGCPADSDQIFIQSGGNPLFALEIARSQTQVTASFPGTLETLIQGRLRLLDDSTRELLPWAAALGRSFNPTTLATIADCPLPRLLNAIDQLEQHDIIRPSTTIDGEVAYNFAHDIVRQVAYEQLSAPRRKLIHTHIAQALTTIAAPVSPLINDVAHHADLGSDHSLATRACLQAAERCLRVFAYAEAAELTQRGIHHCQYLNTSDRIHLHINLLKTWVKAGVPKPQATSLKQELQSLIQEAIVLGCKEDESTGLEALIVLNYDHGNLGEVHQYSLRAAEQGRTASPATTMYMLAHTGACLAEIGREMTRAEALLLEAQSISDRLGTPSIDIPFGLGCIRRFHGHLQQARSLLSQSWQMAQIAQDHWRECTSLINLIMLELEAGQPTQALHYSSELIHVSAQMGGGSEAAHAAALDAVIQYLLEERNAVEALEQSCCLLQQIDSPRMLAYVQTIAARWDLHQGDWDTAINRAEVALAAAQLVNNPSEIALAWSVLIQAGYQRGNRNCAQQHFADLKVRLQDQVLSAQARQLIASLEADLNHPNVDQGGKSS